MTSHIQPIENSYSNDNVVEYELMQLFLQLFDSNFNDVVGDIGHYGMAHLGRFPLIERFTTADGIAIIRSGSEPAMRYLFRSWKFRNRQRGFHFLDMYLRTLIGDGNYEIAQLWQDKAIAYPNGLKTMSEIISDGDNPADYFLTSRIDVRVQVLTLTAPLVSSIRSAIAARLVLDLKQASYMTGGYQMAGATGATVNHYASATISP